MRLNYLVGQESACTYFGASPEVGGGGVWRDTEKICFPQRRIEGVRVRLTYCVVGGAL